MKEGVLSEWMAERVGRREEPLHPVHEPPLEAIAAAPREHRGGTAPWERLVMVELVEREQFP